MQGGKHSRQHWILSFKQYILVSICLLQANQYQYCHGGMRPAPLGATIFFAIYNMSLSVTTGLQRLQLTNSWFQTTIWKIWEATYLAYRRRINGWDGFKVSQEVILRPPTALKTKKDVEVFCWHATLNKKENSGAQKHWTKSFSAQVTRDICDIQSTANLLGKIIIRMWSCNQAILVCCALIRIKPPVCHFTCLIILLTKTLIVTVDNTVRYFNLNIIISKGIDYYDY